MKKIILFLLFLFASSFMVAAFMLGQFRTIEIEGKGDTGHERSMIHPFICRTGGATERGIFYYCDYKTFFNRIF